MKRRFIIEIEGDFDPETIDSDVALEVDSAFSDRWGVANVRDFSGEDGCLVTEVTDEHGQYAY